MPFSLMGKRLGTKAVEWETHEAFYGNISPEEDLQIVENVPEYGSEHAARKLGPEFDTCSLVVDPRVLGLPASRARIYIIGWKKSKLQWIPGFNLMEFMDVLTSKVAIDVKAYWSLNLPPRTLTTSEETQLQLQSIAGFGLFEHDDSQQKCSPVILQSHQCQSMKIILL